MRTVTQSEASVPLPIRVERDRDGLRMAVFALFEESLQRSRIQPMLDKADSETCARILDDLQARELSPGYYIRAAYLLDLSHQIELGLAPAPGSILQSDIVGLGAVREARAEFEREHPVCHACGERQDNRWMKQCYKCNAKLRGGA